jgi:hypothetical protein
VWSTPFGVRRGDTTLLELDLLVVVLFLVVVIVVDVTVILKAGLDLLTLEAAAHRVALLVLPALEGG